MMFLQLSRINDMCICINTTECVYLYTIYIYDMYMCIVHRISVVRVAPVMPTHTLIHKTNTMKILLEIFTPV